MLTNQGNAVDKYRAKKLLGNMKMMQAFVDGKTIQYQRSPGEWVDINDPTFDDKASYYRIKPEPVEAEVWYNDDTDVMFSAKAIFENDAYMTGQGFRKLKMREVA